MALGHAGSSPAVRTTYFLGVLLLKLASQIGNILTKHIIIAINNPRGFFHLQELLNPDQLVRRQAQ